jgi:hypothetical protein
MDSCYIWDGPDHSNYQQGDQTTSRTLSDDPSDSISFVNVFRSDEHRKVAMYVFKEGAMDDTASHGTHVATSIVGSRYGLEDPTAQPEAATGVRQAHRRSSTWIGTVAAALLSCHYAWWTRELVLKLVVHTFQSLPLRSTHPAGIAPRARVAVYDVGSEQRSDDSVLIVQERDLSTIYEVLAEVSMHCIHCRLVHLISWCKE